MGRYKYGLSQEEWHFCKGDNNKVSNDYCKIYSCNTICNTVSPDLFSHDPTYAILDSGASGHYINNITPCFNKSIAHNGPTVTLPNNEHMIADHITSLYLPSEFSPIATHAHLFPKIETPLLVVLPLNVMKVSDKTPLFQKGLTFFVSNIIRFIHECSILFWKVNLYHEFLL